MPDLLDSTGLQIKTRTEIFNEILDGTASYPGMRGIYGQDINVEPNSPDAQMVEIFTQAAIDLRELAVSVYNSFDPDKAVGRVLDARCAINGIYRNAGTYTTISVNVTTDRGVALPGLDNYPNSGAFTISDSTGNKFSLVTGAAVLTGTTALTFRALALGALTISPHALTFITTPTLGVLSVDNPSVALSVGTEEETDAQLRLRRMRAMAIPARGSYESILSAAEATEGVVQASLYENVTNTTDANGVAPHGIWLIVEGGDDTALAEAVYPRRPLGTPMQGSTTVNVTQVDGTLFPVKFSRPTPQLLYLNLVLSATDGAFIDYSGLGYRFLEQSSFSIGGFADLTTVVSALRALQPNILVSSGGVSLTDGSYAAQVSPSAVNRQFYLADTSITINGTKLNVL